MGGPLEKKQKTEHSANWPFERDDIVTVTKDGITAIYNGPVMTILLPQGLRAGTHIQFF